MAISKEDQDKIEAQIFKQPEKSDKKPEEKNVVDAILKVMITLEYTNSWFKKDSIYNVVENDTLNYYKTEFEHEVGGVSRIRMIPKNNCKIIFR